MPKILGLRFGGKERGSSGHGEDFRPELAEVAVLRPFLMAEKSEFSEVRDAVYDSADVPAERRDDLLNYYSAQRHEKLAELGKRTARGNA